MFLPISALPGLREYKYQGEDHSLISRYILGPFYTRFVLIFPLWMAPNLITLIGFLFVVVNTAVALYYNSTFDQQCPSWVYLTHAIGLFLYQTFDACDGKQARRTKMSGPLGELFDHCVDACNTTLEIIVFATSVNLSNPWLLLLSQAAGLFTFYLSTWEEYHTGVLYLSVFSGPVEGILTVIVFYLVTFFTGPRFWTIDRVAGLSINDMYLLFAGVALALNVYQSYTNAISKSKTVTAKVFVTQLLPFLVSSAAVFVWAYFSPQVLDHIIPLMFAVGINFSFTVGRIILAHVTNQPFPGLNLLVFVPALAAFISYMRPDLCVHLVWLYFGLGLGVYGSFVGEVVAQITGFLGIECFTVKKKVEDKAK